MRFRTLLFVRFRNISELHFRGHLMRFRRTAYHTHVLVPFVVLGVNAVLRSLKFNQGDALLVNTYTYGAVQNTCRYVADRYGKKNDKLMISDKLIVV